MVLADLIPRVPRTGRVGRIVARTRRSAALTLLLLVALFLGLASQDNCHPDHEHRGGSEIVHILCADGCAVAPLPEIPTLRLPDPLPEPSYVVPVPSGPLGAPREPEEAPPRIPG